MMTAVVRCPLPPTSDRPFSVDALKAYNEYGHRVLASHDAAPLRADRAWGRAPSAPASPSGRCLVCQEPTPKAGRHHRRYCALACRQAAWVATRREKRRALASGVSL